jgi:hypothetical protein
MKQMARLIAVPGEYMAKGTPIILLKSYASPRRRRT